jgi:hypothetical protein
MAVRMRVGVGVGVIMAVVMGIGRRHEGMLYYNITSVYGGDGRNPQVSRQMANQPEAGP